MHVCSASGPSTSTLGNLNLSGLDRGDELGGSGWGVAATYNLNRRFGITGDISGHYSDQGGNWGTLAFGPQIAARSKHFKPFTEVLFGVARTSPPLLGSHYGFALLAGGGLDLRVTKHIGIRMLQADLVSQRQSQAIFGSNWLNGGRVQSGFVISLGGGAPTAKL